MTIKDFEFPSENQQRLRDFSMELSLKITTTNSHIGPDRFNVVSKTTRQLYTKVKPPGDSVPTLNELPSGVDLTRAIRFL